MAEPAILMEDLTCDFGPVRAVDHLSLEVPAGVVYGFLGPNGSGKTTTIHLLLGLLEPTAGRALVLGRDTRAAAGEIRGRCGALLEHSGLYEQLSAEDNLEFYARVWRLTPAARRARVEELLRHFGLWERRAEAVESWSRGMKQKLALARAILHRPALVFLDEPTAGLDVLAAAAVRDDLAALAEREGVTVFLTTHNMAEAERLCRQVAVIRAGRLVTTGSPEELRAHTAGARLEIVGRGITEEAVGLLRAQPGVAAVERHDGHLTLDLAEAADTGALVTLLVRAGVVVEEARRGAASLEEVFRTLMEEEQP